MNTYICQCSGYHHESVYKFKVEALSQHEAEQAAVIYAHRHYADCMPGSVKVVSCVPK